MARAPLFNVVKTEYRKLWDTATLKATEYQRKEIEYVIALILKGKEQYLAVEKETGVPWWFIGCVHSLECSNNFAKHLHNGDPLAKPTIQVPAGRPSKTWKSPPGTWVESAIDAIRYQKFDQIKKFTIELALYKFEAFNGWGYRNPSIKINSPYLWSYTNHYTSGKYIKDGVFSRTAVSKQPGIVPILKGLIEKEKLTIPYE